MKRIIPAVAILACGTVLGFGQVRDLSRQAQKYAQSFDHVILEETVDVNVRESGMSVRSETRAVQVFSVEGCRRHHTVSFFYDPQTSHLEVTGARRIRGDSEIEIPLSRVRTYPQPARAIYWPNIRVSIPFGLLEPGDIIVTTCRRKGFSYALLTDDDEARFTPPMAGHFYDIVPFQDFVPILSKRYTVSLPRSCPIRYRFYNGEVQPALEFTEDGMRYTFTRSEIPALAREPHMVDISDVGMKLLVSTTPSWKEKSKWFHGVNEEVSFNITPEIQRKVDALTAACRSDAEKIDVLNHWVAHYVRYSGISMGEGEGFTLHPAAMIFRDRTGVCKDKAGLLITFLRAAGFDAYAAMTMAGARIEDFPADHFNHCVVALRREDGGFTMLDPTWVPWVREQWSSAEQEQQYLIGTTEGQDLMTTPYSPAENHYYRMDSRCRLTADGDLRAEIRVDTEGQVDARLRRTLHRDHDLENEAFFRGWIRSAFPEAVIQSIDHGDAWDISRPMSVILKFTIPGFSLQGKRRWLLHSPGLALLLRDPLHPELAWEFGEEDRRYGIRSRCTKLITLDEVVRLPDTPAAAGSLLPDPVTHAGRFADLDLKVRLAGRNLHTHGRLVLKKRIYPPEAQLDLQTVFGGLRKVFRHPVEIVY